MGVAAVVQSTQNPHYWERPQAWDILAFQGIAHSVPYETISASGIMWVSSPNPWKFKTNVLNLTTSLDPGKQSLNIKIC